MPVIEVHLIEGYADEAKTRLCEVLTDASRLVIPAPPDAITVMIHDHAPAGYARGRRTKAPAPALPDPGRVVRAYLAAMEARELNRAKAMLGDGFEMRFPGGEPMTKLEELIEWSRPRYKWVRKHIDAVDVAADPEGHAVVHCHGTLYGEWHSGVAFEGIRFIDRFEVTEGKITRQDVWNDMALRQALPQMLGQEGEA